MSEFFTYEILRIIWWLILGFLLIGFAVMDGFSLGVQILMPVIGKNEMEKRVMLNAIGPVWEGNQVWFILGGGTSFAAWPYVYAVAFSGFYFAMLLVLLALILRPVSIDYWGKVHNHYWKKTFEFFLFIAGFVPSLVFGVAMGNVIQGVAFDFNDYMVVQNYISFGSLFTPFTLLCGLLSVVMFASHGAFYLAIKTEDEVKSRAIKLNNVLPWISIALFAVGGYHLNLINGYKLVSDIDFTLDSNPLLKDVTLGKALWFTNYEEHSWIIIAPIIAFAGFISAFFMLRLHKFKKALVANAIAIAGVIATVGATIYPFILPSSLNPSASLMVFDASSSYRTLAVMLVAVIIFMPLILIYTSWVYYVMRGKITATHIKNNSKTLY